MTRYEIRRHKYTRGVEYAVRLEGDLVTGAYLLPRKWAGVDWSQLSTLPYDPSLALELDEHPDDCEQITGRLPVVFARILQIGRLLGTRAVGCVAVAVVLLLGTIACAIAVSMAIASRLRIAK